MVSEESTYYIPNAFTPNSDGKNDGFGLIGTGIHPEGFEMIIFNRWGEEVFYTNDLEARWDGRMKGKAVQDGVYAYRIKFKTIDKKEQVVLGHVSIVDQQY